MSANILRWRPHTTVPPAALAPKRLWILHKQSWRIECVLQGREPDGWSIRVLLNGDWFFCCRFTSWSEAIQTASDKYTELVTGGWAPTALSGERQ